MICIFLFFYSLSIYSFHCFDNSKISFKEDSTFQRESNEKIVLTPFGPAQKKNVHYISRNQIINDHPDMVSIVDKQSCRKILEIPKTYRLKKEYSRSPDLLSSKQISTSLKDGWISYAYCQIMGNDPEPPTSFSACWIVPSNPVNNNSQILYLFNSINGRDSIGRIIQPVLQWGITPAGGGNYWAICNWYVTDNQIFYDSLIAVNS